MVEFKAGQLVKVTVDCDQDYFTIQYSEMEKVLQILNDCSRSIHPYVQTQLVKHNTIALCIIGNDNRSDHWKRWPVLLIDNKFFLFNPSALTKT